MERASVTRLFKDRKSQETIMLLEAKDSQERFRVTVPGHKAGILALEGHGLSDRCSLYKVISECVAILGGAFGSVVVTLNDTAGVNGAMAISRNEEIISWISGDVVELVAFALHVQLPIYVQTNKSICEERLPPETEGASLPSVIEEALSDILNAGQNRERTRSTDYDNEIT